MSSAHHQALIRQLRREITVSGVIGLLLFGGAQLLPLGEWLRFVVQHESSQLDEIIFVFMVLSVVFPCFSLLHWRELWREVRARALAVQQLEESAHLNAQLSQMTNLLHACVALEEATPITHTSSFPTALGRSMSSAPRGTCCNWRSSGGRRKAMPPWSHPSSAGHSAKGKCTRCPTRIAVSYVCMSPLRIPICVCP